MGKVVTHLQIKNKWDHLKKRWKQFNECFENDTGLGYDTGTGMLEAVSSGGLERLQLVHFT